MHEWGNWACIAYQKHFIAFQATEVSKREPEASPGHHYCYVCGDLGSLSLLSVPVLSFRLLDVQHHAQSTLLVPRQERPLRKVLSDQTASRRREERHLDR